MKSLHAMKPRRIFVATGALLVTSLFSATTMAHDEAPLPYMMTVVQDEAYGHTVTRGRYENAIRRITSEGSRSPGRFADQVNLCVAYAKSVDMEKAGTACDKALAGVRKRRVAKSANSSSLAYRAYQQDLAIALSNRGVLRAVAGKFELAREDFTAAIELRGRVSKIAKKNLDRLELTRPPAS